MDHLIIKSVLNPTLSAQPMGEASGVVTVDSSSKSDATGTSPAPPIDMMLIIFLVFGGLILLSMFGQRKEKKRKDQMLSSLSKHDQVQTVGGIIGRVVSVSDNKVTLKVDENSNVKITFKLQSIESIVTSNNSTVENKKIANESKESDS